MKETSEVSPSTFAGTAEPPLRQVLADPIVHLVMRRDNLTPDEVRSVVESARARLMRRPPGT